MLQEPEFSSCPAHLFYKTSHAHHFLLCSFNFNQLFLILFPVCLSGWFPFLLFLHWIHPLFFTFSSSCTTFFCSSRLFRCSLWSLWRCWTCLSLHSSRFFVLVISKKPFQTRIFHFLRRLFRSSNNNCIVVFWNLFKQMLGNKHVIFKPL